MARLSEHPHMSYLGHPTWPPEWTWVSGNYDKHPDGEAGLLENVRRSAINDNILFLTMSYGGGRYFAHLSFDDPRFSERVCEPLKFRYGRPINMIGKVDIF